MKVKKILLSPVFYTLLAFTFLWTDIIFTGYIIHEASVKGYVLYERHPLGYTWQAFTRDSLAYGMYIVVALLTHLISLEAEPKWLKGIVYATQIALIVRALFCMTISTWAIHHNYGVLQIVYALPPKSQTFAFNNT